MSLRFPILRGYWEEVGRVTRLLLRVWPLTAVIVLAAIPEPLSRREPPVVGKIPLPPPLEVGSIAYSPDGKEIACLAVGLAESNDAGANEMMGRVGLIRLTERRLRFLTTGGLDVAPVWRTDGRHILFFRWVPQEKAAVLFVVAPGEKARRLFKNGGRVPCEYSIDTPDEMSVTADDAWVIFSHYLPQQRRSAKREVSRVNLVTGETATFPTIEGYDPYEVAANPQEPKTVAYDALRTHEVALGKLPRRESVLVVGGPDRAHQRVIDRVPSGTISSLAWSADGKALAYVATLEDPADWQVLSDQVRVWDAGANKTRVIRAARTDILGDVAWAPDGAHLACVVTLGGLDAGERSELQIWRVKAASPAPGKP
jgi:hypothetical protein